MSTRFFCQSNALTPLTTRLTLKDIKCTVWNGWPTNFEREFTSEPYTVYMSEPIKKHAISNEAVSIDSKGSETELAKK